MDADKETLLAELDITIEDVKKSRGSCSGHDSLSRGIAMSLRCHRAQLAARSKAAGTGALSGTIAAAFILALQHLFKL